MTGLTDKKRGNIPLHTYRRSKAHRRVTVSLDVSLIQKARLAVQKEYSLLNVDANTSSLFPSHPPSGPSS
jgi:hypothetical protein